MPVLPLRSAPRHRALLIAFMAVVLVGAGCSKDDGTAAGPRSTGLAADTSTTRAPAGPTSTAAPDVEAFAGYADHQSAQYRATDNWICHPELGTDPCRKLDTTVLERDGSQHVEQLEPSPGPGFDCFYVYPTTSSDPGTNSDLEVDDSEIDTVRAQVGRYSSVCRVFAPAYRQISLVGLGKGGGEEARDLAYGDVLDSWKTYITDFNNGRGVVLIGHSQGAGHLRGLIAEEIDPEEGLRSLLVSAVLLGTAVADPGDAGPADAFQNIQACSSSDEAGCVISYSSYPATEPPGDGALFGRTRDAGQPALCVNPAELAGGDGLADVVLPTKLSLLGGVGDFAKFSTPFVSLPGALRTKCETTGSYSYLAVEQTDAADKRPVAGLLEQRLGPTWGLHLLDANLAQDDLIEVVTEQAEAHGG